MTISNQRRAELRAERRARRVLVDGNLVAVEVPAEKHGRISTSVDYGCRCTPCRATRQSAKLRWSRGAKEARAARIMVDGMPVYPGPIKHGTSHARNFYGCRCRECGPSTAAIYRTHCAAGHAYTEANTASWGAGQGRICRQCKARYQAKWRTK